MVEQVNPTISGLSQKVENATCCAMNAAAQSEFTYAKIGLRLAAVREGFSDLDQSAWAAKHNFGITQWNNWERGERRIPVESAERLCDLYGVTLDFIYRGRRDGLSETASKVL